MASARPVVGCGQFIADFDRANPVLQQLFVSEVLHLRERIAQLPKTWMHAFDRVAGLKGVLEVKVGGGPRMLVCVDEIVMLWRAGDHDIVSRTVKRKI